MGEVLAHYVGGDMTDTEKKIKNASVKVKETDPRLDFRELNRPSFGTVKA
jgi:hypothetical protein